MEYEDEVSGVLLAWEFHPCQQWRAKEHHLNSGSLSTSPTSPLSPVHTNLQLSTESSTFYNCVCVCVCVYVCVCVCVWCVCVSRVLLFCGPCLICISISKQSFTDTANVRVVW